MKNNIQYEKKDLYPSSKQCGSYLTEVGKRVPLFEDNENSKLCSAKAFQQRNPARTISYSDISQTNISGFPICIARDESGELQATFCEDTHGLIIGSTGSGKTTGFVLPFLNWMPSKKNKPSIVVSDPKNELNEQTVNRFIKEGYRVIWLNFQDYTVSDCWNPLTKIYRTYQKYLNVEDEVTVVSENGKKYNKFRGIIYKKQSDLDLAILTVRDGNRQCRFKLLSYVRFIVSNGSPDVYKRNGCESCCECRDQENIFHGNGDNASNDKQNKRRSTGNRKLIALAGRFQCITHTIQGNRQLVGLFLSARQKRLVPQSLMRGNEFHQIHGHRVRSQTEQQYNADGKQ